MRPSIATRKAVFAVVATLTVAMLVPVYATKADDGPAQRDAHYQIRAIRSEGASASVLYRLDSASGEICAFTFAHGAAGEARGCVADTTEGPPGRFALEALQGVRGTNQSSAYRLDRFTGEICRFRLPATPENPLEAIGCVTKAPEAAAP